MFRINCSVDGYVQKQHKKTKKTSKLTRNAIPDSLDIGSCIYKCLRVENQHALMNFPGLRFLAYGFEFGRKSYCATLSIEFALHTDQFFLKDLNEVSLKCVEMFLDQLNMLELKSENFKRPEAIELLNNYDLSLVVDKNITGIWTCLYSTLTVQDHHVNMDFGGYEEEDGNVEDT
jgi:hypothetical protein